MSQLGVSIKVGFVVVVRASCRDGKSEGNILLRGERPEVCFVEMS